MTVYIKNNKQQTIQFLCCFIRFFVSKNQVYEVSLKVVKMFYLYSQLRRHQISSDLLFRVVSLNVLIRRISKQIPSDKKVKLNLQSEHKQTIGCCLRCRPGLLFLKQPPKTHNHTQTDTHTQSACLHSH